MRHSTFAIGMIVGIAGGLVGTAAMYLFGACIFIILGWSANTSFLIIGNSAAAFLAGLGIHWAGGVALGARLFFLIGLAMGAILGAAVIRVKPLRLASPRTKIGIAVVYVEMLSLPLLAAGCLALKMDLVSALLWFSISFVMHLVYGLVLGAILCIRPLLQPSMQPSDDDRQLKIHTMKIENHDL